MKRHVGARPLHMLRTVMLAGLLAGTLGACAAGTSDNASTDSATDAPTEETFNAASSDQSAEVQGFDELIARRFEVSESDPNSQGNELTFHAGGGSDNPKFEAIPDTDELTPVDGLDSSPKRKPWTVMVYITGANLESEQSSASNDITEMKSAGVDFEQANVLYMTGGSRSWSLEIPNNRNVVWDLETLDYVAGSRANSMGDPATLASFINFADTYYPAEHTMLVLWDHGGGPIVGYGADELAGGDGLSIVEMVQAMEATPYHDGKKLDIVGFDACLMGSIEVADVWSDYADMLIASEEVEQGIGWDWSFLSVLNDKPKAKDICVEAVDSFQSYYQGGFAIFAQGSFTLAAYDLSATSDVISAVDDLSASLQYDLDAHDYSRINAARNETTEFGVVAVGTDVQRYDLLDLRDFVNQFSEFYPAETGKINESLDRLVVHNAANIPDAYGVSVYLPATSQLLWDMSAEVLGGTMGKDFRNLTTSYAQRWNEELGINWTLSQLDLSRAPGEAALSEDGTEYCVPLDDEQLEGLDQASYTVLAYENGTYRPLLSDVVVVPNEEGVLHVPADPNVLVLASSTSDKPIPLFAQQISQGVDTAKYMCPRIRLIADGTVAEEGKAQEAGETNSDDVAFVVSQTGEENPVLNSIPFVQSDAAVSRATADLTKYQAISSILGYALKPAQGDEGTLLPYTQWDEDTSSEFAFAWTAIDDSLELKMVPASSLGIDVSCQVSFTDQYGTLHATDLFELKADA